jgi:hypothetical protein
LLATIQQKPVVELASAGLAFILARRLLGLGALDLNDYGERADYRSLSAECVLEVSGTEDVSELGRRHREKVAQALDNTYGWGACVVVCLLGPGTSHPGLTTWPGGGLTWRKRRPSRTPRRYGS